VKLATSDPEIARCYPVVVQLRPHLSEDAFVPTVRRQQLGGYELAFVEDEGEVAAVAGFRLLDNLFAGRMLYVDDLVTDERRRSKGFGKALFDDLVEHARANGCLTLELDSGVQRFDAHRFYLSNRMAITSHHFRLKL
jgi:GNAT superfamily N-acetyltransferase